MKYENLSDSYSAFTRRMFAMTISAPCIGYILYTALRNSGVGGVVLFPILFVFLWMAFYFFFSFIFSIAEKRFIISNMILHSNLLFFVVSIISLLLSPISAFTIYLLYFYQEGMQHSIVFQYLIFGWAMNLIEYSFIGLIAWFMALVWLITFYLFLDTWIEKKNTIV